MKSQRGEIESLTNALETARENEEAERARRVEIESQFDVLRLVECSASNNCLGCQSWVLQGIGSQTGSSAVA
eukprot:107620-Amphidinium_carterae.1